MVAADGTKTAVRWAMVPLQNPMPRVEKKDGQDYLFRKLISDIHDRPLQWDLVMTIAGKRDAINDPSQIWAQDDQKINAGTLTLAAVQSEDGGPCTDITFDPLILPPGIQPSADPILQVRSAAYTRSFSLRSGEMRGPSAVTPDMTQVTASPEGKKS